MEDLNYLFNNSLNESLFNDVLNGKVNLFESILDPVQKTRCRDIFNEDDIMHPKVKNEIKNRFYLWYKQLNSDKKIFDIVGFKMIGSSSGFQYTDSSDIDVQVIIKMHANHDFSETKKLISILPNNNNLPGTLHPINYYFVDEKDPTKLEYVENLYNLDTKEWEKKADKLNMTIPLDYIREISRFFTDGFDLAIGRYDRDKQYLIDAFKLDPEKQEISEKEKNEVIEKRLTQFQVDIDSLRLCVKLAHGLNADAYSDKTPFKIAINYNNDDPRYSVQNIIYKGLDKFDYIGKMVSRFKEGNQVIDKYKKKMKNLTESYDDLFSDIIDESTDELFDDSVEELNESFRTMVHNYHFKKAEKYDKKIFDGTKRSEKEENKLYNKEYYHRQKTILPYQNVKIGEDFNYNGLTFEKCSPILFSKYINSYWPKTNDIYQELLGYYVIGIFNGTDLVLTKNKNGLPEIHIWPEMGKDGIMKVHYKTKPYSEKEMKKLKSLTESDDIFSDAIKEKDLAAEKEKLSDIIDILKGIQYGFISKKDGSRIIDRDWIHSCRNLNDYYDVQTDPEETLKNKLGICTDQCILIKYLINKYHPEIKTQMYGMTMGPFGHCLISLDDGGKLYHLENAWNLEQGLHGSFDSEDELKEYFESLYHKHHDKDTDAPVFVRTYEDYLAEKENLNESENSISKIILK